MLKAPQTEEYERCVICGELTHVPVSTPIEFRDYYEIGCGQLCVDCARKERDEAEKERLLSDARILRAVELSRRETQREE